MKSNMWPTKYTKLTTQAEFEAHRTSSGQFYYGPTEYNETKKYLIVPMTGSGFWYIGPKDSSDEEIFSGTPWMG